MIARGQALNFAVTLFGVLIALSGGFVGYASSATGKYGELLRFWAIATAISLIVLGCQVLRLRGWLRYITMAFMVLVIAMSINPLGRLTVLGWRTP
ncbi:hypothetical protein [Novosphingobium sp.]|uniref:hypothetical protein n=1 Tax=Novosphingobium sp. TaxID=1874826 RepID=UPI003B52B52F